MGFRSFIHRITAPQLIDEIPLNPVKLILIINLRTEIVEQIY